MALSHGLTQKGTPPERLEVTAVATFVPGEGFTKEHLTVRGRVPGIDQAAFQEAANGAKENCPISQALSATPIELKAVPVSFPIDLQLIREKLAPLLESKTDTLLLELDDVEAATQPGAVWAVFVGPPAAAEANAKSPYFVGQVALFGSGIRDEAHHEYKPAHFTYPITRALQASLQANADKVNVTFVPLGIVIDGKPTRPEVKSPVRVGKASLSIERAREAK